MLVFQKQIFKKGMLIPFEYLLSKINYKNIDSQL